MEFVFEKVGKIKSILLIVLFIFISGCALNIPQEIVLEMENLPDKIDFNYHVKPILSDRCYSCHGPDSKTRKAGLRLDIEEIAFSKLESGNHAFSKGDIYSSESAHRIINNDPNKQMPPPESNLSLSNREKALILKWIDQGAIWKEHWAFISPQKRQASKKSSSLFENEIDQFLYDKLLEKGLDFEPISSKESLIRKLSFDLMGLPPSIDQIDEFISDTISGNYDRLVDRMMNSQAFAERLTLDWLDLSRYADSHGLHADGSRNMWPWRDWVIKAFQRNMPYDQFVTWQLAGDLLPNATREQKLATAFNRNSPMTAEGGVIDEEWRLHYVFDRSETFSTAFLGLTVACAKCHDHKFDPISQKDYYQLSGFFNNIRELGMTGDDGDYGPLLYLPTSDQEKKLELLKSIIEKTKYKIDLTKQELDDVYNYIGKLPTNREINNSLVGYYKFDEVNPVKSNKKSAFLISNNSINKADYFVADRNLNVKSNKAPKIVDGIKKNAFEFRSDYDRISISKEIPNFEWTDSFSIALWAQTNQKKNNKRQILLGTTGSKNNWWRGWDFYLDDKNYLNIRLINIAPSNMIHVRSKKPIEINQWAHLAFTYNGMGKAEGIKLFNNGVPFDFEIIINNLSKSIKPVSASGLKLEERPILVGKTYEFSTGDNGLFMGKMDELKIYDKPLSALELKIIYNQYFDDKIKYEKELIKDHWIKNHPKYISLNKELEKNLIAWRKEIEPVIEIMVMEEMSEPRKTYLYNRGNYNEPSESVSPNTPDVLPKMDKNYPKNRLGLAQWLFQENHPLTSRVAVNRYWQLLFGNGLVNTPTDFGVQGSLPSHPELLDWLAIYFEENNWNVRTLIKKIVSSRAYKQKSVFGHKKNAIDPNNIFLARGSSYRLPAEMIRNNALAVSGLLSNKLGGPSVKPYQPKGLWKEKNTFSLRLLEYQQSEGENLYRRGMYTFIKRGSPPPSLITFDATSREICTIKREKTSSPLQSLILLNDTQFFEASRVFAERIFSEAKNNIEQQIKYGFRLATSRFPKESEVSLLKDLYQNQLDYYRKNKYEAYKILTVGNSKKTKSQKNVDKIAAMTMVANTLLNLNESYYKY